MDIKTNILIKYRILTTIKCINIHHIIFTQCSIHTMHNWHQSLVSCKIKASKQVSHCKILQKIFFSINSQVLFTKDYPDSKLFTFFNPLKKVLQLYTGIAHIWLELIFFSPNTIEIWKCVNCSITTCSQHVYFLLTQINNLNKYVLKYPYLRTLKKWQYQSFGIGKNNI